MTIPYIIYNNVKSSDLGLQIEQMSSIPMPVRKYQYTDIPGADGQLVHDYGTYEDVQIEVRFNLMNMPVTAAYLNSWLTGTGTLVHSDEPTRYYIVKAVQMNTRYRSRPGGNNYDSVSAIFLCEPYRYLRNQPYIQPDSWSQWPDVYNAYNAPAMPRITISGSTKPMTITFTRSSGVSTVIVDNTAAVIDCWSHNVYIGNTNLNPATTVVGDWPVLMPGSNILSMTNVTGIAIEPRFRDL